jgi:ATP-dependent Clp protease adaptor protein ClpS
MKNELNKEYTDNLGANSESKEPSLYQVVVQNDDYTPMEFVVGVLEKFFFMERREATDVMLEAHVKGRAAFGRYTKDLLEAKIVQVMEHARISDHPLNCSMEAA